MGLILLRTVHELKRKVGNLFLTVSCTSEDHCKDPFRCGSSRELGLSLSYVSHQGCDCFDSNNGPAERGSEKHSPSFLYTGHVSTAK